MAALVDRSAQRALIERSVRARPGSVVYDQATSTLLDVFSGKALALDLTHVVSVEERNDGATRRPYVAVQLASGVEIALADPGIAFPPSRRAPGRSRASPPPSASGTSPPPKDGSSTSSSATPARSPSAHTSPCSCFASRSWTAPGRPASTSRPRSAGSTGSSESSRPGGRAERPRGRAGGPSFEG